jgi:hypothetical protein
VGRRQLGASGAHHKAYGELGYNLGPFCKAPPVTQGGDQASTPHLGRGDLCGGGHGDFGIERRVEWVGRVSGEAWVSRVGRVGREGCAAHLGSSALANARRSAPRRPDPHWMLRCAWRLDAMVSMASPHAMASRSRAPGQEERGPSDGLTP